MKKRLEFLDYAKGFAILLMIFGHVEVYNSYIFNWIYSFHMPIFFIIGGFLMEIRESKNELQLGIIIKKRFFQLMIPYLFGSLLISVYFLCLQYISGSPLKINEYIKDTVLLKGINVLWFIPCYFLAEICLVLIIKYSKWLVSLVLFIFLFLYYNHFDSTIAIVIGRVSLGCIIMFLGYALGKKGIIEYSSLFIAIIGILIGSAFAIIEGYTSMAEFNIGTPLFYVLTFMIMSVSFLFLFKQMDFWHTHICDKVKSVLAYWGRNSLVILVTHNLFLEIFRLLDYKLTGLQISHSGLMGSIPVTIFILLIEIPIIYLANNQLRFLFGK